MLIVVEGLDGAGKSTQVRMLKNYLEEKVSKLEYIHFPRYDAPVYGDMISRFLRGDFGSNSSVHPALVALLFAEDRHGAAPLIRKALSESKTVLLDRYVYSNIAYQCAKLAPGEERDRLREWIFEMEYKEFGIPKPDMNIFLDVPIAFVENHLKNARTGNDRDYLQGGNDIHEADIEFQKEVRDEYIRQTERDAGFIPVDCCDDQGRMLPPDSIFERLKDLLDKKLCSL